MRKRFLYFSNRLKDLQSTDHNLQREDIRAKSGAPTGIALAHPDYRAEVHNVHKNKHNWLVVDMQHLGSASGGLWFTLQDSYPQYNEIRDLMIQYVTTYNQLRSLDGQHYELAKSTSFYKHLDDDDTHYQLREGEDDIARQALMRALHFCDQLWAAIEKHQKEFVQDEYIGQWEGMVIYRPDPRTNEDVHSPVFVRGSFVHPQDHAPVIWRSTNDPNYYTYYLQAIFTHKVGEGAKASRAQIHQLSKDVISSMKQYFKFAGADQRSL